MGRISSLLPSQESECYGHFSGGSSCPQQHENKPMITSKRKQLGASPESTLERVQESLLFGKQWDRDWELQT